MLLSSPVSSSNVEKALSSLQAVTDDVRQYRLKGESGQAPEFYSSQEI